MALGEWQRGGVDVDCGPGLIAGNPVAEDIAEAASKCAAHITIHTLADGDDWKYYVAEDGLDAAREELIETGSIGKRDKYPIVVAAAPGDSGGRNLVQAHKGLRHAAAYCEPGGIIIYDAPIPGGFGSPEMASWMDVTEPEDLVDRAHDEYDLNAQTAISFRQLTREYQVLWTGTEQEKMLEPFGVRVLPHWRDAIDEAKTIASENGSKGKVAVIPEPTRIIPKG